MIRAGKVLGAVRCEDGPSLAGFTSSVVGDLGFYVVECFPAVVVVA